MGCECGARWEELISTLEKSHQATIRAIRKLAKEASTEHSQPMLMNGLPPYGSGSLTVVAASRQMGKTALQEQNRKAASFIKAYAEAYKARYGNNPACLSEPKTIGQIKNWMKNMSEEKASQLITAYLQIDSDRRITESQHDLTQFFWNLNKIGNALAKGGDPSGINWAEVFR